MGVLEAQQHHRLAQLGAPRPPFRRSPAAGACHHFEERGQAPPAPAPLHAALRPAATPQPPSSASARSLSLDHAAASSSAGGGGAAAPAAASRTARARPAASSEFCRSASAALSRPGPNRSPPSVNQAPLFSTRPRSQARS